MKVHEKAKMYDEMMKDFQSFISELEIYHQSIENIESDPELIEMKSTNIDNYYPMLTGKLKGSNFGLSMKINKYKGMLNWYQKQK
jgi:hypothetical protein